MLDLHPSFRSRFSRYRDGMPTAKLEANASYRPSALQRFMGWLNADDGTGLYALATALALVLLAVLALAFN